MPPVTTDRPPGEPERDDDPTRPPPRPVAPPGQVSTPDQLPTVEPGEWPAQPRRAPAPAPAAAPAPVPLSTPLPPAPGPPAAPYPPAPARRSLAWLWVAVAAVAVLVVGAAATLVVVRAWDDTSDSNVADAPPVDTGQAEQPDNASAEPAPTSPTAPAEPTTPPAVDEPVTADLDGDGYGDAVAVFGSADGVERVVLSSTGRSFTVAREPVPDYEDRTWADFDGDGALDQVSWNYELGGTLNVTSEDMDFRELNLRLKLDERQPYVTLKPGDFDGDGAVDLVAYGATGRRTVGVWILRNDDGRFADPQQWMAIPDATYALTTLLPADFNADGRTDVAARVPSSDLPRRIGTASAIELGIALLTSRGRGFLAGPIARPTDLLDDGNVVVGDFTGDGVPRLLVLGRSRTGLAVQGLRPDGARFAIEPRLALQIGGRPSDMIDAVVADVDGDGVDDIVYTTAVDRGRAYDGFRVLRLRRATPSSSELWAPTPQCPSGDCSLYFQNSY
jgi:hypothetical protein